MSEWILAHPLAGMLATLLAWLWMLVYWIGERRRK